MAGTAKTDLLAVSLQSTDLSGGLAKGIALSQLQSAALVQIADVVRTVTQIRALATESSTKAACATVLASLA